MERYIESLISLSLFENDGRYIVDVFSEIR